MASDRTAGAANEASGLAAIFRRACRVMDGSMVDTDERESVLGGDGCGERGRRERGLIFGGSAISFGVLMRRHNTS